MDMQILIPSGKITMNGYQVMSLKKNPYIMVDGLKVLLSDKDKRLAREMQKVFAPILDKEGE